MRRSAALPRKQALLRAGTASLTALLLAGCLVLPDPATRGGEGVFGLYVALLIMAGLVFVGVEGMIIYSVIRYRRRDATLPAQMHGNTLVEIIWTAIPTVIILIVLGLSFVTLANVEAQAEPGLEVEVSGGQWFWEFRYLDGDDVSDNDYVSTGTIGDPPLLAVPVDEPVRLILRSRDVIHAFFVPRFLIKRDVVPVSENGRPNELEFTVNEVGAFTGQCAEFCGDLHADMTFVVQSMGREEFDQWLADAKAGRTPAPSPTVAPSLPPDATEVTLVAEAITFEPREMTVTAGQPFVVILDNQDVVEHDFAIYNPDGTVFFQGERVAAGETITYNVPALEAGEYVFNCPLHHTVPDMTGTVVAE
jgi:cytochrome c oxidase subunit 2